jgi:hypothetical protein
MRLFRHVDPTFNRLAPTKNSRTLSDSVTSLNRLGMSPICAFETFKATLRIGVEQSLDRDYGGRAEKQLQKRWSSAEILIDPCRCRNTSDV